MVGSLDSDWSALSLKVKCDPQLTPKLLRTVYERTMPNNKKKRNIKLPKVPGSVHHEIFGVLATSERQ